MSSVSFSGKHSKGMPANPWVYRLVGTLLALHCLAILVGPWSVPPSSLLSRDFYQVFEPYIEATFLNHGYHFFAPDPGPSHLVRYEVIRADGSQVKGLFPDRDIHWPRLAYHRHFMLTEHLNSFYESGQKELGDLHAASYANHLLKEFGGTEARLFLVRHQLATPEDVQKGKRLNDSASYRERPLGTFPLPVGS